jgi:nucleotide-binding universal stress UspA family protein
MHTDRQMPLDSRPNGGRRPPDRPVVCAVDDDGLAADVIATGAALAERLNVSLTVVHSPYPDVFLTGEARRLALERGHALVDEVTDGYVVDERIVEVDDPARLISAVAAEGASLIVLGTRGRTGLKAALLGSVSQAVMASAPCPVVTVSGAVEVAIGATGLEAVTA